MNTSNIKRKLLLIGAPVMLVGAAMTTMAASAAQPTATPSVVAEAAEAAEPTTAAEAAAEANEPALPRGGHADVDGANADYQFDGIQ